MRAGVVSSAVIHAALLTWGLWSLGTPKPLDAQYAEALPVEVIMSDKFEGVKGEKDAPLKEKPAPTPTTKPKTLPMEAKNIGDNEVDLDTPPIPNEKPVKEEAKPQPKAADLPPPTPKPEEKPVEKVTEKAPTPPEPKPEPKVAEKPPEPKPVPKPPEKQPEPPKIDPLAEAIAKAEDIPDPKPEVKPEPKPEVKPAVKPVPPKTETAEATKPAAEPKKTDSKAKDKPKKDVADKASDSDSQFNVADISALINKKKAAGGGAKRSTEMASLGSKVTTGTQLSRSEKEGLQEQLASCWTLPAGAEGGEALKTSVRFSLDGSGKLAARPTTDASSGNRAFDESAIRAVQKCDRDGLRVPPDVNDEFVVNFDPHEMF
ncbi:TonB C-terminal domain-containing protein [Aureimonas leprariae]|nr:TonB C-terminal domain-containing protein [Aureimonas leprariae]